MTRTHHLKPTFQLRLALHNDVVIGPGKADLLEMIDQTGSISAAGRALKMSYKKAWQLIETMNSYFSLRWLPLTQAATSEVVPSSLSLASRYLLITVP